MKNLIFLFSVVVCFSVTSPAYASDRSDNIREACEIIAGVGALLLGNGNSRICQKIEATDQAVVCRRRLLESGYTRAKAFLECSQRYRDQIFK